MEYILISATLKKGSVENIVQATFKKGSAENIVQIMVRFKKVDAMAAIVDYGFSPGKEFQFQMVAPPEYLDEVTNAFVGAHEVDMGDEQQSIDWHYKWNRNFEVKPEDTI